MDGAALLAYADVCVDGFCLGDADPGGVPVHIGMDGNEMLSRDDADRDAGHRTAAMRAGDPLGLAFPRKARSAAAGAGRRGGVGAIAVCGGGARSRSIG
ncbi:MAG: hypothetical protein FWD61_15580 [Phycisphaerales bacterium]|nr:hypothetical protein [Phycisphaerales bacterium]